MLSASYGILLACSSGKRFGGVQLLRISEIKPRRLAISMFGAITKYHFPNVLMMPNSSGLRSTNFIYLFISRKFDEPLCKEIRLSVC